MIRKNPERVAWLVIVGAFLVFLGLCAAVPLGLRYYLLHATASQETTLEVIGGTVRVREPGVVAPLGVTKAVQLPEGSAIETDETSRGILTFLDGSTMILFPGTQITLRVMRVVSFPWGIEPTTIQVDVTRGSVRVGAAPQITQSNKTSVARQFLVSTPQLTSQLDEGSYRIEVLADSSNVIVNNGTAYVSAQGKTVTVPRGQRTVARPGEAPIAPVPAAQDIIVNGDFRDPLARGWMIVRESGTSPTQATGTAAQTTLGDRAVIQILRNNSNQTSAIAGVIQPVNREVSDYHSLKISADIRIHLQSLSGGGILSSEYPILLRIKYRDVYGSEAEWVHGFYIQNLTNNPTTNSEMVSADVWIPFESGNLLETADPRPFYITSLQIYASGWDYESYVTAVRLIVE
jgi:hypothetical protein